MVENFVLHEGGEEILIIIHIGLIVIIDNRDVLSKKKKW
jgi:hypothetical protein